MVSMPKAIAARDRRPPAPGVAHIIAVAHLARGAHDGTLRPMFDVAVYGGSVDPSVGGFPARAILCRVGLGAVLLAGLLWGAAAQAGTLYHCTGANGETVFSSSAAGYHGCHKISTHDTPASYRKVPPPRVGLERVAGTVTTTARGLSADGSEPASLARAWGGVETSARALGSSTPRVARATAQDSAEPGAPGQWSYRESKAAQPWPALDDTSADDPQVLRGAVYRIVRADGSVEYTNLPPAGRKGRVVTTLFTYIATCAACNLHSPIRWGSVALNLTAYTDAIRTASVEFGVDEAFLRAIIHAESAFNPRALSLKGAQGLMQLMPGTASDMGVLDAFNTDQNIRGGARYLGLLLRDFNGNEQWAAAAYNAGPAAVQRYSGVPPYAETRVYVSRVATLRKRYGAAIHSPLAQRGAQAAARF
jgi:soluble lytic murein transglycosylase-like protein